MTHLAKKFAELEAMSPAQLRARWRDSYRKQVPDVGPDLLRRSIAWKLQSRVDGKLPVPAVHKINKMIARLENGGEVVKRSDIALKTGTRLVREWRGKSYHIQVCDNGFEYNGRHYDSLSHIAGYITGAHWVGAPLLWLGQTQQIQVLVYEQWLRVKRLGSVAPSIPANPPKMGWSRILTVLMPSAAYILSQASEGWEAVPEYYDDGGYSGGSMKRPALAQLLADVEAHKVDVIVVYKVDRLTRSLADFAKIVEIIDEHEACFVSVTQSFNTTTSMGRLTLNVLLSFAQFEREVTGERIRDKIAASKKKGMWMGGPIPIGYDLGERKLVVNKAEAYAVRHMFKRYALLKSVPQLVDELAATGYRTKIRKFKDGRIVGGIAFRAGSLTKLLHNPVYIGKVRHKDTVYEGEHDAIIAQTLFDEVHASLQATAETMHWARNPTTQVCSLV